MLEWVEKMEQLCFKWIDHRCMSHIQSNAIVIADLNDTHSFNPFKSVSLNNKKNVQRFGTAWWHMQLPLQQTRYDFQRFYKCNRQRSFLNWSIHFGLVLFQQTGNDNYVKNVVRFKQWRRVYRVRNMVRTFMLCKLFRIESTWSNWLNRHGRWDREKKKK